MDLDFENLNINCKRAAFSIGPYIELMLFILVYYAVYFVIQAIMCLSWIKRVGKTY
ncbi:hypothetical protein Psal006b_01193 [Piscirickettsia salmonis]|uniref:Uncharacterized protein n=1 Tax=Piscirickettsia salmonis TaxID=1238 RepID=A0AAC8ZPF8_PISSA|nr:hypothetical protein KU39_2010 [Piscirickettsia salmonis]QGN98207.1 hypothetical protein Psal006b_01193 [Piscirickettsia salmonis]QGO01825.1 hypothetical protein Psal008_01206 [Piscirickettsia salmonis]QGO12515.1 hypothetical protein Psal010b_01192 [Piscirickettsia salmonis]QGO19482.1 hypothetical protein Psal013_01126 [Piscirickettsia salmonis]